MGELYPLLYLIMHKLYFVNPPINNSLQTHIKYHYTLCTIYPLRFTPFRYCSLRSLKHPLRGLYKALQGASSSFKVDSYHKTLHPPSWALYILPPEEIVVGVGCLIRPIDTSPVGVLSLDMTNTYTHHSYSSCCLRKPRHRNTIIKHHRFLDQLSEYNIKPRNRDRQYPNSIPTDWDDLVISNRRHRLWNK